MKRFLWIGLILVFNPTNDILSAARKQTGSDKMTKAKRAELAQLDLLISEFKKKDKPAGGAGSDETKTAMTKNPELVAKVHDMVATKRNSQHANKFKKRQSKEREAGHIESRFLHDAKASRGALI
jgi:hypothetical protein